MLDRITMWSFVLAGIISSLLAPIVDVILLFIAHRVFTDTDIHSSRHRWIITQYMAEHAINSSRVAGHLRLPSKGFHFAWGIIVRIDDNGMRVFTFGKTTERVRSMLNGDLNGVFVQYIEQSATTTVKFSSQKESCTLTPFDWQEQAIDQIVTDYENKQVATALIMGKPGTGKSALGRLIAVRLARMFNCEPCVIEFNPTIPGLTFTQVIGVPNALRPMIVVIDEFDCVINYAIAGTESRDGISLARNEQSLLSNLDRLSMNKFTITIFTSNMTRDHFETDKHQRHVRYPRVMRSIAVPDGASIQ